MTCISASLKGLLLCGDERSGAVITCTIKQIFLPSQWLCPREAPLRCHTTFHSKDIISQTPSPKSFWFIRPENRFYCVQSFKFIRKLHTVCQVALTQSGFRLAASPQRPEWWSATETVILPARSVWPDGHLCRVLVFFPFHNYWDQSVLENTLSYRDGLILLHWSVFCLSLSRTCK